MTLFGLHELGMEDMFFMGLVLLFVIEQFFYWFLGSYLYRYGILIKTVSVPIKEISSWYSAKQKPGRLAVKINKERKEIYLHYKYPIAIVGPLLFVGQIKYNGSGVLKIRVGPLSTVFILSLIISLLLSGAPYLYRFINFSLIAALIVWFYFRFFKSYEEKIRTCFDK